MKLNQLNGFVFDSESGVIGEVAGVDFIKQTISIIEDGEDEKVILAKLANAIFLEEVGAIGGTIVINHDVVETPDGKMYEIVLVDSDKVQLHLLDKKLNRIEAGDIIAKTDLHVLEPYVELVDNIYLLKLEDKVDFNIKVVRTQLFHENEIAFFYACNNVEKEEIDLIKVVFVGHHLIKEELYERFTLTHEEYLNHIENKSIIETDPSALITLMNGKKSPIEKAVKDTDTDIDTDCCEDCGGEFDCDCREW